MDNVPSPCIRHCCLNEDDVCLGCFRSMQEIMQWGRAEDSEKKKLLELAQARKQAHKARYDQKF